MFTFLSNNHFSAQLTNTEAFDALLASQPLSELLRIAFTKTQSPLYYLLLRLHFVIFGASEVSIRGLASFLLLLVGLLTFILGKTLWGKKTGLFAASLVLSNPYLFYNTTKSNSLLLFIVSVLLSSILFLKKKWKSYVASAVFALYTSPIFFIFFLTQHMWILYELAIKKRERVKKRLKYAAIIFILSIPMFIFLSSSQSRELITNTPVSHLLVFVSGDYFPSFLPPIPLSYSYISLFVMGVFLSLRKWNRNIKNTILTLLFSSIPVASMFLYPQVANKTSYWIYLSAFLPYAYLFIVSNKKRISTFPFIVLLSWQLLLCFTYSFSEKTYPLKKLHSDITTQSQTLATSSKAFDHYWQTKYYKLNIPYISSNDDHSISKAEKELLHNTIDLTPNIKSIIMLGTTDETIKGFSLEREETINGYNVTWYNKN